MITTNSIWIYPEYFTPQKVNQIHAVARKYELEESMIELNSEDPAARTHYKL